RHPARPWARRRPRRLRHLRPTGASGRRLALLAPARGDRRRPRPHLDPGDDRVEVEPARLHLQGRQRRHPRRLPRFQAAIAGAAAAREAREPRARRASLLDRAADAAPPVAAPRPGAGKHPGSCQGVAKSQAASSRCSSAARSRSWSRWSGRSCFTSGPRSRTTAGIRSQSRGRSPGAGTRWRTSRSTSSAPTSSGPSATRWRSPTRSSATRPPASSARGPRRLSPATTSASSSPTSWPSSGATSWRASWAPAPLALAVALRGYRRRRSGWVIAGWLVATWQLSLSWTLGLPFAYLLAALCLIALVAWLRRARPKLPRPMAVATAVGIAAFLLAAALLARPYLHVQHAHPQAHRSPETVAAFSGPPWIYLVAPDGNLVWGDATAGLRSELTQVPEKTLFPGLSIVALAVAGLGWAGYARGLRRGLGIGVLAFAAL